MRLAIIESGVVTNITKVADGWTGAAGEWQLPPGATGIQSDSAGVGDTWDGETFTRPTPPVVVPQSVTPLQARKALRAAGLLASVNSWLEDQDEDVREVWEYALTIERTNPIILSAATALGLTDDGLDALFVAAAQM